MSKVLVNDICFIIDIYIIVIKLIYALCTSLSLRRILSNWNVSWLKKKKKHPMKNALNSCLVVLSCGAVYRQRQVGITTALAIWVRSWVRLSCCLLLLSNDGMARWQDEPTFWPDPYTDYVMHWLINTSVLIQFRGVVLLGCGLHHGDETIIGWSCLHGRVSCTGVMASL